MFRRNEESLRTDANTDISIFVPKTLTGTKKTQKAVLRVNGRIGEVLQVSYGEIIEFFSHKVFGHLPPFQLQINQ